MTFNYTPLPSKHEASKSASPNFCLISQLLVHKTGDASFWIT